MTKKYDNKVDISATLAREDDGTIQINISIPKEVVLEAKKIVLESKSKDITVPGFRKGKAPLSKIEDNLDENDLKSGIINKILPNVIDNTIQENKLSIVLFPKVELTKADNYDEDWKVTALTCVAPVVELGNYKTSIKEALTTTKVWTPNSDKDDNKTESTVAEKEQLVIEQLLKTVKVKISRLLIDEELNQSLSALLERLEKLGLTLDNYLKSLGKTPQELRSEYENRAKEAITYNIALTKIADEENITIDDKELQEALKMSIDSEANPNIDQKEKERIIEGILKRRKAMEMLVNLK